MKIVCCTTVDFWKGERGALSSSSQAGVIFPLDLLDPPWGEGADMSGPRGGHVQPMFTGISELRSVPEGEPKTRAYGGSVFRGMIPQAGGLRKQMKEERKLIQGLLRWS